MPSQRGLLCFALLLSCIAHTAFAQVPSATRLDRLRSESSEIRMQAAEEVYGAGLRNKAIYTQIAETLEKGLVSITKDSPRLEELAWHAKALGASGDLSYLPLLERVSHTGIRYLARHANGAIELLQETAKTGKPYFDYSKALVITDTQATDCQMIKQDSCSTSRSPDRCIEDLKYRASEAGGNAVLLLANSQSRSLLSPLGGSTSMYASFYVCPELE